MTTAIDRKALDELYRRYNKRSFVNPDPLQFLYDYEDPKDREIVGLVASALAYGRVQQILRSVSVVLSRMPRPYKFLIESSQTELADNYRDFKHRFADGKDLVRLLQGIGNALRKHGSLENCFLAGFDADQETVIPSLINFVNEIHEGLDAPIGHLLPFPERGSACKRLLLFLRWMVRLDHVDPGGWYRVSPSKLVVPLDTHMHKISIQLGLTTGKQANLRTALEVTAAFREICPEDPVRYDFVLTRFGIRSEITHQDLYDSLGLTGKPTGRKTKIP